MEQMDDTSFTDATDPIGTYVQRIFLPALIVLACASSALAQPDVRLSPTEPLSRWLLPDVLVQSAAHLGDTTLAVWGSTVNVTDTSIVPVIDMCVVREGTASVPRRLSDDEARPYGVVSAIAVGDRFLVLWNDHRTSSPGIHARVVSSDGSMEDAFLFSPGVLASDAECRLLRTPTGGYMLLWTDLRGTQPAIWLRSLDDEGHPIGAERLAGAGRLRPAVLLPASSGGGYLVGRVGLAPLYLRPDGTIAETNVPGLRLDRPYLIGNDGTLVTLSDSLLTIATGPPDSAAIHSVRLRFATYALPKLSTIRRDSTGYTIIYPAWLSSAVGEFWLHRLRVEGDSLVSDTVLDYRKISLAVGPWEESFYPLDVARLQRTCDGADTIMLSCRVGRRTGHTTYDEIRILLRYGVDGEGAMSPLAYFYPPVDWVPADAPGCDADVAGRLLIVRNADSVSLSLGLPKPGSLVLPTSTAMRVTPGDHQRPCLYLLGDSLHIIWGHGRTSTVFSYGGVDFRADTPTRPLSFDPTTKLNPPSGEMRRREIVLHVLDGYPVLSVVEHAVQDMDPDGSSYWETHAALGLFTPLREGWRMAITDWTFKGGMRDTLIRGPWAGYDPGTGQTLVVADIGGERRAYELDADGKRVSQYVVHAPPPHALLWWSARGWWLDADLVSANLMGATRLLASTPFANPVVAQFLRLDSSSFLRWYPTNGRDASGLPRDRSVTFERYDIDSLAAGVQAACTLDLPSGASHLAVVERPSDRSIHLLCGADDGLHHLTLDATLQRRSADSVVSATRGRVTNPSALFRADTLFVAWEDQRGAGSYIYGRIVAGLPHALPEHTGDTAHAVDSLHAADSLHIADSLASHDMHGNALPVIPSELLHLAVAPVPAIDHIEVSFHLPIPGEVSLEVYDLLGGLVMRRDLGALPVGWVREGWSLRGVGSGVYFLRLHGPGGAVDTRKIVLLGAPGN